MDGHRKDRAVGRVRVIHQCRHGDERRVVARVQVRLALAHPAAIGRRLRRQQELFGGDDRLTAALPEALQAIQDFTRQVRVVRLDGCLQLLA